MSKDRLDLPYAELLHKFDNNGSFCDVRKIGKSVHNLLLGLAKLGEVRI
jgi:hypothetical protein